MAMLLDGSPSTIDDLTLRDSDLLNVAVTEGVDLTAKLKLATADIGATIDTLLMSADTPFRAGLHSAPKLKNIAVTPHLKLWHIYTTLRLIYQDLFYSRLNDRYQAKMKLYREEESEMFEGVRSAGLGVVFDPIPQAPAPLMSTLQTMDTGGTVYLAISFLNAKREEGLLSVPVQADTQDGTATAVSAFAFPDNVTGWNVYAGAGPDSLTRQNSNILDPEQSFTVAPGRLGAGSLPGSGQQANLLYPIPRRMLRG